MTGDKHRLTTKYNCKFKTREREYQHKRIIAIHYKSNSCFSELNSVGRTMHNICKVWDSNLKKKNLIVIPIPSSRRVFTNGHVDKKKTIGVYSYQPEYTFKESCYY